MQTDDLIAQLSGGLEPVRSSAVMRVLLGAVLVGVAGSILVMLTMIGLRHDLTAPWSASACGPSWSILSPSPVSVSGWWSGPAGREREMTRPAMAAGPAPAGHRPAGGAADERAGRGHAQAGDGPFQPGLRPLVILTALPTLAATFWALRRLAPTRLTLAGAGAGLFAGAAGAFVYSFHCTEGAAPFIAIWYTLGIVLTVAIGALLGPRLLRW